MYETCVICGVKDAMNEFPGKDSPEESSWLGQKKRCDNWYRENSLEIAVWL